MEPLLLTSSIPLLCHSKYSELRRKASDYAHEKGFADQILPIKTTLLTCYVYPVGDAEGLFIADMFFMWGFFIDSIVDNEHCPYDEDQTRELVNRHIAVMQGGTGIDHTVGEAETKCLKLYYDFWKRLTSHTTHVSHFVSAQMDFLCALAPVQRLRHQAAAPDFKTFINVRMLTCGAAVTLHLIEIVLDLQIKDEIWYSNLVQDYLHHLVLQLTYENDVMSCYKERMNGDDFNTPSMLMIEKGCGLTEAVKQVCQMAREEEDIRLRLVDELKKTQMLDDPALDEFIRISACHLPANLHWGLAIARYQPNGLSFRISKPGDSLSLELLPSWNKDMEWSTFGRHKPTRITISNKWKCSKWNRVRATCMAPSHPPVHKLFTVTPPTSLGWAIRY